MLSFGKPLPNRCSLLSCGDHIILTQAVLERVPVLAVEECNPFRLLPEVLADRIKLLSEHPDRGVGVAAGEGELGQHVLLLSESLGRRAVVDEEQGRLTLEALVEGPEVDVEPLPKLVCEYDPGILPDPRPLLVSLIVFGSGAHDHDMPEDPAVGSLEEVEGKDCLPTAGLPTDNSRVGVGW